MDGVHTAAPAQHHCRARALDRAVLPSGGVTAVNVEEPRANDNVKPSRHARTPCWRRLCEKWNKHRRHERDEMEDGIVYREPLWQRLLLASLCGSSLCLCAIMILLFLAVVALVAYTYRVDQVNVRDARDISAAFGKQPAATVAPGSLAEKIVKTMPMASTATDLHTLEALLQAIDAHASTEGFAALTAFLEDEQLAEIAAGGRVTAETLRVPGYARARGADASEREAHRPMDDVALLQWRHELSANTRGAARAPANASSASSSAAAATAVKMHLYGASSVLNRRYYYGVRRAERAAPYASTSVWTTKAWYDAVAGSALWDVYGDAGVPDAEATSRADSVRLRMHDLSAARVREVEQYESHGDLLPPRGDARTDVPTIFVSLASYRDVQCAPTLVDLFQKAKNAHRVYVGLAEQNRAGDASCMAPLELHEPSACLTPAAASDASDADVARVWGSVFGGGALGGGPAREAVDDARRGVCFYADHVRVRAIDADEAKGPTYGRYMAMLLYRGETLTLVLDSHNRFTPFWDTLATHQYYRYDDPKTVLSHYPASLTDELKQRGSDSHFWLNSTRYECGALFRRWSLVRMVAADVPAESVGSVYYWANNLRNDPYVSWQAAQHDARSNFRLPQPWVAGGFLFANASIMREVPFDPHLPHIFDGEEVLYSVRLWTHGYNIFSPVANVVFHDYHRTKPLMPSLDDARSEPIRERSEERTGFLMRARRRKGSNTLAFPQNSTMPHLTADSDRYGCGRERTVEQWHWYAGVDPVNLVIAGHWC